MSSHNLSLALRSQVLKSTKERIQEAKFKETITASRLQFERVGLCGRRHEIDALKSRLDRLSTSEHQSAATTESSNRRKRQNRELVLLRGESGTGKTALAMELMQPVLNANGVFCSGKYDLKMTDEPYVGISMVCNQLVNQILALYKEDSIRAICQEIVDLGDSALSLLGQVSIDLNPLILRDTSGQSDEGFPDQTHKRHSLGKDKKTQLLAAIKSFFQIVTRHLSPVVVLLDDLQWADLLSLKCIKGLMLDSKISLMLVGCYRSDEVGDNHVLSQTLNELREQRQNDPELQISEIQVGNLLVGDVKQMLIGLLGEADSLKIHQLAKLCHDRTTGNVFFVRAFLSTLVEEGFLKLQVSSFRWEWDVTAIEQETSATENLVSMIQNQMTRLSGDIVHLLLLASCLGCSFERDTLWLVWEKILLGSPDESGLSTIAQELRKETSNTDVNGVETFERLVGVAMASRCMEGIHTLQTRSQIRRRSSKLSVSGTWQSDSPKMLRFVHDKVQEAAMSLMPAERYELLQVEVGQTLERHLSDDKLDSMVFVVASLLNKSPQKRVEIAELDLRAAYKAIGISSQSAARFVRAGIEHLHEGTIWETHFDLALSLHSLGARAEMDAGNVDCSHEYCSAVLQQQRPTVLQRCPVWRVKQLLLHNQGQIREGLEFSLDCLRALGCEFPRSRVVQRVVFRRHLQETIRQSVPTKEDIVKMPMMTDPTKLETMKILEEAGSLAYLVPDRPLYIMIRCRFVQLVAKHGLTDETAPSFASLGTVVMHRFGLFDMGKRLAELALEVQELCGSKFSEARTLATANGYVLAWVEPLQSRLKYFMQGYNSGIQSGNMFSGGQCPGLHLLCQFQSGARLAILQEDFDTFAPQLEELGMTIVLDVVRPLRRLIENLADPGFVFTTSTGKDQFEKTQTKLLKKFVHAWKSIACMFFREYETGAEIALKMSRDDWSFPGIGFGYVYLPFGVCLYAMSRTKPRKYKSTANLIRSKLRTMVKGGCLNLVHHLRLLDAEFYATNGKVDLAGSLYSRASLEAARGGFLQDRALANERHALFLLEVQKRDDASFRMAEAVKNYAEWGAFSKVRDLREKYADLLSRSDSSTTVID